MKRFKVFGALLSAAAMVLSMPLAALADSGAGAVEEISTTGWVEVSNAAPKQGDVISMTISLDKNATLSDGKTPIKGIAGLMRSVVGATPVLEPTETPSELPDPTQDADAAEPTEEAEGSEAASVPDDVGSDDAEHGSAEERNPDNGWHSELLNYDDLFIVIGEAEDTNWATRYFLVDGEPGSTVRFEFSGRCSDGTGDHEFVATHEFQIASGDSTVSDTLMTSGTGAVRTVDGSSLQFRLWPELSTIEGIRGATMKTKGTSPGELLRNLKLPSRTSARVFRGDTNVPRLSAVCTGDTVRFATTARGGATEAVAVVRGDILGNGKLGLNQLVAMSQTLSGEFPVDEARLQAADINGDGKVTSADATALKKLVLGRG